MVKLMKPLPPLPKRPDPKAAMAKTLAPMANRSALLKQMKGSC